MSWLLVRRWCGLLVGWLLFSLVSSQAWAQTEPRFVRVGIYDNPPKIFRSAEGQATGVYGDILNYVAQQENWQINYVPGTFEDGLNRLISGEIDLMVDAAVSEERAGIYDFTKQTVLSSWGVVYVARNSDIDSVTDLDGKRVAILKSSVYADGPEGFYRYIKTFGLEVNFFELEEYSDVFSLLVKGEVDAAIVSRISGQIAEAQYPSVKATDIIFSPTELRFALPKGDLDNPYLIDRLDYWVSRLKSGHEGVYQEILKRHGLLPMTSRVEVVPGWVLPASIVVLIILVIAGILLIVFRRARSAALRRLGEQERYLSKVVDNVPVVLASFDHNGVITLAVGKALPDFIAEPGKLIGTSIFQLFKDQPEIIQNAHDALAGREAHYQTEAFGRVFRVFSSPLKVNGKVSEVVVIAMDVTEESHLEKAKSNFITLVQHQLRTPPGAMRWALELLGPKVGQTLDPDEKNIWKMLETETAKMINLANSLSLVSEIEAGLFAVKPEPIDLPEVLEENLKEFLPLINEKKIILTKFYPDAKLVTLDKTVMGIVFHTLISNAVAYSYPDGKVAIELRDKGDRILLSVKDDGPGIPKDQQAKIFTKLFRCENAPVMNPEGLGLDLYLTKSVVERLGGKIWFETSDRGTTFLVELLKT